MAAGGQTLGSYPISAIYASSKTVPSRKDGTKGIIEALTYPDC
jgi:hypothetical protein